MAKILSKKKYNYLLHFIIYDIVWISSIYSAANGDAWIGFRIAIFATLIQILWLKYIQKTTEDLPLFVSYLSFIGCLGDSFLIYINYIAFSENPFPFPLTPPFMVGIWLNFSVTFYATLQSLIFQPMLLGLLTFFGFMIAYYLGASMGAATLVMGSKSLLMISLMWSIVLPLSLKLFNYFRRLDNKKR